MTRTAVVIIASSRAAAGVYPDRTGPLIETWLRERDFTVTGPVVVADGPEVGVALQEAIGADLILTSGGTGISPTDASDSPAHAATGSRTRNTPGHRSTASRRNQAAAQRATPSSSRATPRGWSRLPASTG